MNELPCDCGHAHDEHWGGTEDCSVCSCTYFLAAPQRDPDEEDVCSS